MQLQEGIGPNMNWHLVWRTFLKTWRGYKFIFEIESENPFWPGGQNYLEWNIEMTSISALIFQFSFFQEKMHCDLYWASTLNAPRINGLGKKCGCTKNKGLKQKQSENAVYIKLRKKICILAKTCINSRVHMSHISMLHCTSTLGHILIFTAYSIIFSNNNYLPMELFPDFSFGTFLTVSVKFW